MKSEIFEEKVLTAFTYQVEQQISTQFAKQTCLDIETSLGWDRIILKMRTQLFGEDMQHSIEVPIQQPRNWWQHFKMQHFPSWLLVYFPVDYQIVTREYPLTTRFIFPKAYVAGHPVLDEYVYKGSFLTNPPQQHEPDQD